MAGGRGSRYRAHSSSASHVDENNDESHADDSHAVEPQADEISIDENEASSAGPCIL